jgi:alpha-L-arabinofuranosidase
MKIRKRINFKAIFLLPVLLVFACTCGGGSSNSINTQKNLYSSNLFGANFDWQQLAGNSMLYGDLIRDRSFRSKQDLTTYADVWGKIEIGGNVTFYPTGGDSINPAGGKYYPGDVKLQSTGGFTGIVQQLSTGVKNGINYKLNFSSFGVGGSASILIYLYKDSGYTTILASATESASVNSWTQHDLLLTPNADSDTPILGIYVTSNESARIDEIRLAQDGAEPTLSSNIKTEIQNLGIKALRWPGGTLSDWFTWQDSVGTRVSRGELLAYKFLETPALGLHEFLNLCEELNIQPLIQVNVFDTTTSAADLVEYILGDKNTTQGSIRNSNGRTNPWNACYFEIGNEPAESYAGAGSDADAGKNYALLANSIISAMKAKAQAIGKTIHFGVINEPCFQKASWLIQGASNVIDLLYYWNSKVFANITGVSAQNDFTNGHFYGSRYYSADPQTNFLYAMSGGELLAQTIRDKIAINTDLPFWLTEYSLIVENSGTIQVSYLKDFQSGIAAADILMRAIEYGVDNAYIYNLIDLNGFGIIRDAQGTVLRPAGLAFQMISVIADEEVLNVSIDNPGTSPVIGPNGNVPSNFTYPLVSALASVNKTTGKPRVLLLNRSYDTDMSVTLTLQRYTQGNATCNYLQNNNLTVDNETTVNVAITSVSKTFSDPFTVTVPMHTLMRIDFLP